MRTVEFFFLSDACISNLQPLFLVLLDSVQLKKNVDSCPMLVYYFTSIFFPYERKVCVLVRHVSRTVTTAYETPATSCNRCDVCFGVRHVESPQRGCSSVVRREDKSA